MLLTVTSTFATGTDALPLGVQDFSRSQAHLNVTKGSPELTTIALESPAVETQEQLWNYQTYQTFSIAGEYPVMTTGGPSVPQVSRFYRIPNTGGADLVINEADYEVVDNVNAFPVQPEEAGFNALVRNEAVYSKDGWYPENVAVMSDPMIMRDFRVVTVTLYPVQVNPVTHQARIYRNLSVDVVANNHPGVNELLNPRRPSSAWASIYRNLIPNLDDMALDDVTTDPGSYLILTSNNAQVRPWADTLAEWKTRRGFKVTVDSRGTWSAQDAITRIRTAYTQFDPPLEFVTLMGDPGWNGVGIPSDGGNYDHSFALGNTQDELEDIGVGRLSCGTGNALGQAIAKIMAYEREPHMQNAQQQPDTMWFRKSYLLAGIGNSCAGNYLVMRWAKDQFLHNTGVDSSTIATHDGVMTGQQVTALQTAVNNGIGYMLWRGSWQFQMPNTIADGTSPAGRFPICMCVTCNAGDFTGSGNADSPAEDWLSPTGSTYTNPKGGVAGMGTSSAGTMNGANVVLAAGLIYNMADVQVPNLGTAVNGAKAQLYLSFGPSHSDPHGGNVAQNFSRLFNLFGDPGLEMWTDVPKVMDVTHPAVLNVGDRAVSVSVVNHATGAALDEALVVLWKRGADSTWVKGLTDGQGRITLPVAVGTAGNMYLTVTKRGYKPYLFTIPCGQVDAMPMNCSVVLDDDNSGGTQGNGDHLMNPGETIDLPVYIKNFGSTLTVTGISATLTSSDPRVTVTSATAGYTDLAPGDSVLGSTPYRIVVGPGVQNHDLILLSLAIASSAGQTVGAVSLECHAGEMRSVRSRLSATLDPGATANLTAVVRNVSTVPLTGVTGHITPLSPFVHADDAEAVFGDIAAGALDSNTTDVFTLTANTMAFRGLQVPVQLILSTATGFADTVQFTISVGSAATTDPTGPDAYGYYAYDNTDVNYEMHPTYSYVNISGTGGTNLNLSDPGDKTDWQAMYSTARRLPFGFKFYGQVYDTITVCSNGWCAFGNQSYIDMFRNYPIPSMGAPSAMIAPYWDDLKTSGTGQGVWVMDDAANHRYIIQWKAGVGNNNYGTALDFEVVLYDTTFTPTMDGNGQILMQYNVASGTNVPNQQNDEAEGCTIGIQAPNNTVGLGYAHRIDVIPGSATIATGRAIMFTTEARHMFGAIQGTVLNAADNLPMAGARVSVNGYSYHTTTDASGHYLIPDVLVGTYALNATFHRFNADSVSNIVVALDDTASADFSLHHPVMELSETSLWDSVGSDQGSVPLTISNSGNGPLDYETSIFLHGDPSPNPWDSIGNVSVTQITGDGMPWGCEFFHGEWWVSGPGTAGQPTLYRFDTEGNAHGSVPQPATTMLGWFDLATDGQYLYGSDNHSITGIDTAGVVQVTIPSPLNPCRAIAYDPAMDYFWIADYTSDIYAIDRTGAVQIQLPDTAGYNISGLAWNANDPNGYKLYIFSRDGANQTRITKMVPTAPYAQQTVVDLPALAGDRAAGCTITNQWNSTTQVFAGIVRGGEGGRIAIHEMTFNSSWMHVLPSSAAIPGPGSQNLTVTFNPDSLHDAVYHVDLHVSSVIYDSTVIIPVTLVVRRTLAAGHVSHEIPAEYALHQNYPNPFNPTTQIAFDLPKAEHVRLAVYNSLGQKVATLLDETRAAGSYAVNWDGRTGTGGEVSTGVYFYQIKAGSYTSVKKMLLMR
jgi:hypothetical protein